MKFVACNRRVTNHFGKSLRLSICLLVATAGISQGASPKLPDSLTFRPTVLLRQGITQGSGTVIASVDDETLILTAAHVVEKQESVTVELHRYNLGVEKTRSSEGWPRRVVGRVVARDASADVAVVRVKGMKALPYVAKVVMEKDEPSQGTPVISVGIDKGADLNSWSSEVRGVVRLDMDRGGGDRPFLVTTLPPEHGRSGGGLFRGADGAIVGVCVGRVEMSQGRKVGVFASGASIRRLLRENALEGSVAISRINRLKPPRPAVERTDRKSRTL